MAGELRSELSGKVALIEQDALRRGILMEADSLGNTDIVGLLEQTVNYCFEKNYTVILEGILGTQKYLPVIERIMKENHCQVYTFYIDVSLEETIKRHATKPVAADFGEDKLREWYKPQHYLGIEGEIVIPETSTLKETITLIKSKI